MPWLGVGVSTGTVVEEGETWLGAGVLFYVECIHGVLHIIDMALHWAATLTNTTSTY